jgi:protein-tyrosine phosphatase
VPGFVDVHSHAVPSGDDGARTLEEAVQLCRIAFDTGTRLLFATPHAHARWDHYPRTRDRERLFTESFPSVQAAAAQLGLELRRGWEVFPTVLREADPREFVLEGTRAVLIEFPGHWLALDDDSAITIEAADRIVDARLVPVVAHPERSIGLRADFAVARALVERGCLLCPNGDSALGDNGPAAQELLWRLLDEGLVALIASDGHRTRRPPRLDQAYEVLADRYGSESVDSLVDGSALPWVAAPNGATTAERGGS